MPVGLLVFWGVCAFLLIQGGLAINNWDIISLYFKYKHNQKRGKLPNDIVTIKHVTKKVKEKTAAYHYDCETQAIVVAPREYVFQACVLDQNDERTFFNISEFTYDQLRKTNKYGDPEITYLDNVTMSTPSFLQMCLDGFNERVQQ